MRTVAALLLLAAVVSADIYMHTPRGSNDRLNEAGRDRNNGDRLFDSQNNNRGGVNVGTFGRPYYYVGTMVPIEWSPQHSCGKDSNTNCEMIIQYYCDKNITRDGKTTDRIPNPFTEQEKFDQCWQGNCDMDPQFGRHESWSSYLNCKYRKRNRGLWTSAEDMQGRNGAIHTRQNNNGNRRGYECPEERDYYPYWHPTIWRDVAVVTNDVTRCAAYQAESQNVKSRWNCEVSEDWIRQQIGDDQNAHGFIPITQAECERVQGVWTETKPFGIAAPDCVETQWTRDNHHGHAMGVGYWPGYNWTIPADITEEACVLRLRYNISTSETRDGGEWASDSSVAVGALNSTLNYKRIQKPNGLKDDDDDPDTFKYASQLDVWTKFKLSRSDMAANFDPNLFAQGTPTRGYVLSNNPTVDIFGSLIPTHRARLRLAMDTNQFSRTFQDRTHTFAIRKRPELLKSAVIHNLHVRGKRGNIVQTYPSVEYDFAPQVMYVKQGDFIHFQWTGSNTNPNNNAGQGTQGTDRSNIILIRDTPPMYQVDQGTKGPFPGHTGAMRQSYPSRIDDNSAKADFLGLSYNMKRALARGGIYTPHVDVGPVQVTSIGTFNYMCTRNHAFTNRDQKGKIIVEAPAAGAGAYAKIDMEGQYNQYIAPSGDNWLRFYPDPIGLTTGSQIQITEVDGMVLVTPPLFDVVPGQKVLLEMKYAIKGLQEIHILHSDYPADDPNYFQDEIRGATASGGVASVPITRGGYYWVNQEVNPAAAAGVGIGVFVVVGGVAFVVWKLRRNFSYGGKKAHLMDSGADSARA